MELQTNPGLCCTSVYVRYTPSAAERVKCRRIALRQYAKQNIKKAKFPDYNRDWHPDPSLDDQTDWAQIPAPKGCSTTCAHFTDFPGGGPKTNSGSLRTPRPMGSWDEVFQEFEICAFCIDDAGNETNLGCRVYGHECDFQYDWVMNPGAHARHTRISCTHSRWGGGNDLEPRPPIHQPKQ